MNRSPLLLIFACVFGGQLGSGRNHKKKASIECLQQNDFDLIVVGSGPGGFGFLHTWLNRTENKNAKVLWVEAGSDLSYPPYWPAYVGDKSLKAIDKTDGKQIVTSSVFGGGIRASGGRLTFPFSTHYNQSINKYMEETIKFLGSQQTNPDGYDSNTQMWVDALKKANGIQVEPYYANLANDSSNDAPHFGDYLTMSKGEPGKCTRNTEQYDGENRITKRMNSKVNEILMSKKAEEYKVIGVKDEYGCEFKAKQVVIAAGVYGTFELLSKSGIGRKDLLQKHNIDVKLDLPVGEKVGDEYAWMFAGLEAAPEGGKTCADTASSALIAWQENGILLQFISHDGSGAFTNSPSRPKWMRIMSPYVGFALDKLDLSLVLVTLPLKENIKLDFNEKMEVVIDDSKIEITEAMCDKVKATYNDLIKPTFQKFWKKEPTWKRPWLHTVSFAKHIFFKTQKDPRVQVFPHVKVKCGKEDINSIYHAYGGSGEIVDDKFQVKGAHGLFIADASLFKELHTGHGIGSIAALAMHVGATIPPPAEVIAKDVNINEFQLL